MTLLYFMAAYAACVAFLALNEWWVADQRKEDVPCGSHYLARPLGRSERSACDTWLTDLRHSYFLIFPELERIALWRLSVEERVELREWLSILDPIDYGQFTNDAVPELMIMRFGRGQLHLLGLPTGLSA